MTQYIYSRAQRPSLLTCFSMMMCLSYGRFCWAEQRNICLPVTLHFEVRGEIESEIGRG